MKVSYNDKIIYHFLNNTHKGYETENVDVYESDNYIIKNNCVYGKSRLAEIFLFYKEGDDVYYYLSDINKKYTKRLLHLINENSTLYLMDRQITIPKKRRNILEKVDTYDMLYSMFNAYIENRFYSIFNGNGISFINILFKQIKMFEAEEVFFSDELKRHVSNLLKDKLDYSYHYHSFNVPYISVPDEYKELDIDRLKRRFKINYLIS